MEPVTSDKAIGRIREFRTVLRVLEREVGSAFQSQGSCCGVTGAQCHVLLELEGAGCVSLTGLAARMELDKSTLSRTVDGLVRLGLVSRAADPDNRRQQVICLSPSGREKAAGINTLCDGVYDAVFRRIPVENHGQVIQAVGLLARALVQVRTASPGGQACGEGCAPANDSGGEQ
jgi:DNA-binding MarR family transcriptional regulator